MTVVKVDLRHRTGGYIVSEANKTRSRGVGVIAAGQVLVAGTVLAFSTQHHKYEQYANLGTTPDRTAAAILYDNVDSTDGDVEATLTLRDCEVNGNELVFGDTENTGGRDAAVADLLALGIICRWEDHV